MSDTVSSVTLRPTGSLQQKTGRVLLVGCGEIGSRYLQAVASLTKVSAIEIVDPRPEGHQLGQTRLKEINDLNTAVHLRWLLKTGEATPGGDLCIVATQAEDRVERVREGVSLGYRQFLLEKIVTQSAAEYETLLALAREHQLSIWINCKSRAYRFHQLARERFDPLEPLRFHVMGGNHGLATVGIHNVDLFVFYDRCKTLIETACLIDPLLHPSKRGSTLWDLSGTLSARSEKGSFFEMSFAGEHRAPPTYHVSGKEYRFVLDQWDRWAFESDAASGWAWRKVDFSENLAISYMSKAFVTDILVRGDCTLPKLEECYLPHAFLLNTLQPHFSRLMKIPLTRCPVT